MLRTPEWASWLDATERCLWIHGIPGAGKTVLMSYLIEQIKKHCNTSQGSKYTYVHYYCYFGHNQDESAPFLRWLIRQLCQNADSIPAQLYELFRHGAEPNLVELLAVVEEVLQNFDITYIVIDALDESNNRNDILKVLKALAIDPRFKKLQLLVSGREYIDIEIVMREFSIPISMANPSVKKDIRLLVRSMLQSNSKFKRWPSELLTEVEHTVSTRARGMYVLI